jgi:hypothetical protein
MSLHVPEGGLGIARTLYYEAFRCRNLTPLIIPGYMKLRGGSFSNTEDHTPQSILQIMKQQLAKDEKNWITAYKHMLTLRDRTPSQVEMAEAEASVAKMELAFCETNYSVAENKGEPPLILADLDKKSAAAK